MTPTLINGMTVYEFLKEKGLLKGLTNEALASTYSTHLEQQGTSRKESGKDTAHAQAFDILQKTNPKALAEIKLRDPEGFRRMEEAYLNRPISNPADL